MSNDAKQTPVRTRMAPSPTGEMHIGSLGTILKNYAWARRNSGQFVLRIEDTDKTREVEGAVGRILKVIKAYGLGWDEGPDIGGPYGPYTQSEKIEAYQKAAKELVEKGHAYYCFCSKERLEKVRDQARAEKRAPKYDRHCRQLSSTQVEEKLSAGESYVIRLKVPDNQEISFTDLIRGKITVNSNEIDDQVLLKSDGYPTYHLAVVIDDLEMKITHVMRGEEWLPSVPKHVLIYQAFGQLEPVYAHVPVYLNPTGQGKMSKRKGDVSTQSFLDKGYLPEAVLNFLMILGWAREDEREIMTLEEYIQEFDPRDISAKSVVFDMQKLRWINGVYIRQLSEEELKNKLQPFLPTDFPEDKFEQILPLVYERLEVLADIEKLTSFFYREVKHDSSLLLKKAEPGLVKEQLEKTSAALAKLAEWSTKGIEQIIRSLQEQHQWKKGQYFMMIRIAVTGRKATPPLFETMEVLAKQETLARLQQARDSI